MFIKAVILGSSHHNIPIAKCHVRAIYTIIIIIVVVFVVVANNILL
jgi:hypothetical protein